LGAISVKIGKGWLTVRTRSDFEGVTAESWIAAEARLRAYGAHLKEITAPVLRKAFNDIEKIAETGRKRVDISDTWMSKKAMLIADRSVEVFARYPDDEYDLEPEADGDLFGGGRKVSGPRSPRQASGAKRVSQPARKHARTPLKPAKPTAKTTAKSSSKPAGKAPGAKSRANPSKATSAQPAPVRVPSRRRDADRT